MDLAFVINENYIGQFKVTLYSVMRSNRGGQVCAHVLYSGLDDADKRALEEFAAQLGTAVTFYHIDKSMFEGLPVMRGDATYSAYYKVLLPYVLSHLGKVLFLDCDIVVKGDLSGLYGKDSGRFLSCGADFKIDRKRREHVAKITGRADAVYFNSGVLLFDFSHPEELVPQEEVFAYIRTHAAEIVWHDQDIYNHFYAGRCAYFGEEYNYLTVPKGIFDALFRFGASGAKVVHYANWKPWNEDYIGKCYRLYRKTYARCGELTELGFLKKRRIGARMRLILKYLKR